MLNNMLMYICEFEQIIKVLCNANWIPRNLVLLCALLRDVSSLSQSEWDYAIDTIVMTFDRIEPNEMPGTVFQLLLISKGFNSSRVIYALAEYYNKRLKSTNVKTREVFLYQFYLQTKSQ